MVTLGSLLLQMGQKKQTGVPEKGVHRERAVRDRRREMGIRGVNKWLEGGGVKMTTWGDGV